MKQILVIRGGRVVARLVRQPQVVRSQHRGVDQQSGALHDVGQLTDIPGPGVREKPSLRRRIEALFVNELAQVGFINIAAEPRDPGFFGRRLRLVMDPQGPTFSPGDLATSMP